MRKLIEDYLDGALGEAERTDFQRRVASDPVMGRLVAQMKSERALRAAALASFVPTRSEAEAVVQRVIAETHATLGYVGIWVKRMAAAAAVLIVVAGGFVMGRATAPNRAAPSAEAQVIYRVLYFAESGEAQAREFGDLEDANAFMNQQEVKRGMPQLADAVLTRPGEL
jgi:anti-sigma factor RsiW